MAKFAKREGIMLAYPADEKRINNFPLLQTDDGVYERSFFHQPKLNGERARTEWFDSRPHLISSYGNAFHFLDDIQYQLTLLTASLNKNSKLIELPKYDGEVYVHGWSREQIDSALRRSKNKSTETKNLEYHIFDLQNDKPQYARLNRLGTIAEHIKYLELDRIKIVEYGVCNDQNWLTHCQNYCEDDFEGIILRAPFASYETKRIPGLLKFKPTETDTYRILAVNEAISQDGEPKGMLGSFTVQADDEPGGAQFDVGAGKLTHDKRILYWRNKDTCLGKMLLVKHELIRTSGRVPIAAVCVDILW